jgi:two-component system response regulator EvgA
VAAEGVGGLREPARCAPDLVLLDVGLPDISGIEVARRLHRRDPELAIVVTSTHDRGEYGELATAAGARGFVSKVDLDGDSLEVLLKSPA